MQVDAAPAPAPAAAAEGFKWTPGKVVLSVFLFLAAGLCEIGGGWLVWQAIRERRPWWLGLLGSLVLVGYGGFFILLSYAWGWAVDRDRPDLGDFLGGGIAIGGVLLAWFWPR